MKFSPGLLEVSRSWECEKQTENIKTSALRDISSSLSWHSSSWSHVLCWMIRVFTHKTIKISKLWLFFALRCEWIIFQTCFKTSFLDLGTHDECFQVRSRPTCCKGGRLFCCVIVRGECENQRSGLGCSALSHENTHSAVFLGTYWSESCSVDWLWLTAVCLSAWRPRTKLLPIWGRKYRKILVQKQSVGLQSVNAECRGLLMITVQYFNICWVKVCS